MSKTGHTIKKRDKANDIFITPLDLAKKHIDSIEYCDSDIWYDPFKNSGNYYNQFPTDNKLWSEILEDEDFFEFDTEVDIICSNPPYSMINKVMEKSVSLKPHTISYLIGQNNDWYGFSYIATFKKGETNCINIDRKIYYTDK